MADPGGVPPAPGQPSGLPPEQRRRLAVAIPTTLAVPVLLALAAVGLGLELRIGPLVLGVLGWLVALVLRAPVGLVAARIAGGPERAQPIVVASSGPLEELVRLAVILALGRDLDTVVSIGLGWAAIEVLYGIVNGVAIVSLLARDDPQVEQLRAMLPFPDAILSASPLWGAFERLWASLLHVAFGLLIAAQPRLVLLTMVLHSSTNLALLVAQGRASFAALQVVGAVWAGANLILAIAVTR